MCLWSDLWLATTLQQIHNKSYKWSLNFRPHRTHEMRPIAIDDPGVCHSLCLSRGWDVQKRLNGSRSYLRVETPGIKWRHEEENVIFIGCLTADCQNKYSMVSSPVENVQLEARKSGTRIVWRSVSRIVASVTTRGKLLARIAPHGLQFTGGVRDAEARRLDEAVKKRAARKARTRTGSTSTCGSEHACPTETVEPRSVLPASSVLADRAVLRTKPTAVVVFDNEWRTSSSPYVNATVPTYSRTPGGATYDAAIAA